MSYKYFLDGGIEYLPQSGEILVDGHVENLQSLENKLLIHFVTNPDQLITKEQLYKVGWDDRIYGDNPLSKAISNLRGKLKDNPRSPKYIKTVPKKGFRFVSQVSQTPIATDEKVPQGHQEIHHARQLNYLLIGAICLTALWALIDSLFLQSIQGKSLEIATIKPVTQTPGKKKYPNLSPDQQYVIYSQKTTIADVARIALKHVYSSEEKFITSSEYDSQLAIWHQDGRRILYQRFAPQLCEIAIIELDEKLDVLNDQVVSECGSFSQSIGLSWGPDNTIYYTNTDLEFEAFNIYQLDIHSGKRDTFAIPDVDGRGYYSIHYDPTSDKVHALLSYDWYYTEVVTLNREGKILNRHRVNTPLFTVSSYKGMPVFRTQSNHIHYLLDNKEYRLMQSPLWPIYSPHFSNGSPLSMVFVGGAQNNSELLLVDLEKQTETILTNSSSAHKYPVMTTSGVLYFISNQSGVYQIWSYHEGKRQQLSQFENNMRIQGIAISNDEKYLAITIKQSIYTFELNANPMQVEQPYLLLENGLNPHFSPDSQKLWFSQEIDEGHQMSAINLADKKVATTPIENAFMGVFDQHNDQHYLFKYDQPGIWQVVNNKMQWHSQAPFITDLHSATINDSILTYYSNTKKIIMQTSIDNNEPITLINMPYRHLSRVKGQKNQWVVTRERFAKTDIYQVQY